MIFNAIVTPCLIYHSYEVLDPRISYQGLKEDFADDKILLKDLEDAKVGLHAYYDENYAAHVHSSSVEDVNNTIPQAGPSSRGSPAKTNFTARNKWHQLQVIDELEEYFKLAPQDFHKCHPLEWWYARRSEWSNLYRLACDILCIPGGSPMTSILHELTTQYCRICCRGGAHFLWWL